MQIRHRPKHSLIPAHTLSLSFLARMARHNAKQLNTCRVLILLFPSVSLLIYSPFGAFLDDLVRRHGYSVRVVPLCCLTCFLQIAREKRGSARSSSQPLRITAGPYQTESWTKTT
ncbi:hypothetical protein B0T19DRAFT_121897 [Cercophora scortea]|uniref:Uncharacterized protein n=1 Tax=Cercophora scortea TaxID=314031 RepID=A0AAE0MIV2_9PEZI|nr:hypothetical protein B0T19DRAFT_121897 [Cercophora scortea]